MRYSMILIIASASLLVPSLAGADQERQGTRNPWSNLFDPRETSSTHSAPKPLFPEKPVAVIIKPSTPCSIITTVPQDNRYDRKIERVVPENAPKPAERIYHVPNCAQ
jgi:hypothetical protein